MHQLKKALRCLKSMYSDSLETSDSRFDLKMFMSRTVMSLTWDDRKPFLIKALKHMYPDAKVVGHRDLSKTDCPSFDVKDWWIANEDNAGLLKYKVGSLWVN